MTDIEKSKKTDALLRAEEALKEAEWNDDAVAIETAARRVRYERIIAVYGGADVDY